MYDDNDFFALTKFLKLGIKVILKNPMGQYPSFSTSFPNPKGQILHFDEASLYDLEKKLRELIKSDVPVKTKLSPFTFLGTNFRGVTYYQKDINEFILQETHDLFGVESKHVVRRAEYFFQLLK